MVAEVGENDLVGIDFEEGVTDFPSRLDGVGRGRVSKRKESRLMPKFFVCLFF